MPEHFYIIKDITIPVQDFLFKLVTGRGRTIGRKD